MPGINQKRVMAKPHLSRVGESSDPRSTRIDFSPEVRSAFRDLAAAVHFSDFDPLILQTVQEWAGTRKPSVEDVVTSLPVIASETFRHIHATGDEKAREAWSAIGGELLEHGFTMQKNRLRGK